MNGKLWLGIIALIAAGVAIAWFGAQSVRSRTVQVETVTAGTGPIIQAEDGVLIEYEGRLAADGTVFDTSAGRGPAPILVGQTIPGFHPGPDPDAEGRPVQGLYPFAARLWLDPAAGQPDPAQFRPRVRRPGGPGRAASGADAGARLAER